MESLQGMTACTACAACAAGAASLGRTVEDNAVNCSRKIRCHIICRHHTHLVASWLVSHGCCVAQKLNEQLELVQKERLGPRYDSEATVLNRCVTYSDSGLTWEADPRHAELAVTELGFQVPRPPRGTGAWWAESVSQRVSKTGMSGIRPTRPRVCLQGMQPRKWESITCRPHTLETYRTILTPHATRRVGVPAADRGECREDRWTLRCRRSWMSEDTTLNICRQFAHRTAHLGNLVVDSEGGVAEQRRDRIPQHGTLCE